MKLLDKLFAWVFGSEREVHPIHSVEGHDLSIKSSQGDFPLSNPSCDHPKNRNPFPVKVFGISYQVVCAEVCPGCMEERLNKFSTTCGTCLEPIFPGASVGQAPAGARYKYTHLAGNCTATGSLYCGVWGNGRLVTLHELYPDKYPEGTASIAAHVFKTGMPVYGIFD